jgi:hypothetical protein
MKKRMGLALCFLMICTSLKPMTIDYNNRYCYVVSFLMVGVVVYFSGCYIKKLFFSASHGDEVASIVNRDDSNELSLHAEGYEVLKQSQTLEEFITEAKKIYSELSLNNDILFYAALNVGKSVLAEYFLEKNEFGDGANINRSIRKPGRDLSRPLIAHFFNNIDKRKKYFDVVKYLIELGADTSVNIEWVERKDYSLYDVPYPLYILNKRYRFFDENTKKYSDDAKNVDPLIELLFNSGAYRHNSIERAYFEMPHWHMKNLLTYMNEKQMKFGALLWDVNKQCPEGNTSLHYMASCRTTIQPLVRDELAKFLISNGADKNITNKDNKLPIDLIMDSENIRTILS